MKIKKVKVKDVATELHTLVIQPEKEDLSFFKEIGWGKQAKILLLVSSKLSGAISTFNYPPYDLNERSGKIDVNRTTVKFAELLNKTEDIDKLPEEIDLT